MEIISKANEAILKLMKTFQKPCSNGRMMHYCMHTSVDDGELLFNLLTRELVLLTEEEYSRFTELEYLQDRWFVVPQDAKEKEYMDFVKWMLSLHQSKSDDITGYTIFPTMDCNARCFYCFELERARPSMDIATAEKTAAYIKAHCGGKPVSILWFGGEPLYNQPAIETICEHLRKDGVDFSARIITNGYLFDDETVRKAVEDWHVNRVQITLDGTEEVYNRIKAFIYNDSSPYRRVMDNIQRLLDASVRVSIRLNMDLENADNLLLLVDEIGERFAGNTSLSVYGYHIFEENPTLPRPETAEEWALHEAAMSRLNVKIDRYHLAPRVGVGKTLSLRSCMADNEGMITILPDGSIGVCEHRSDDGFVGHIDKDGLDTAEMASWLETKPEIPECASCFYYPQCRRLKKCFYTKECTPRFRSVCFDRMRRRMAGEYQMWKENIEADEHDSVQHSDF